MKKNHVRLIALLLGVALMAPLFIYAVDIPNLNGIRSSEKEAVFTGNRDDEVRIAADISNLTGVTATKINELRKEGFSWNEILTHLSEAGLAEDPAIRNEQLLRTGLSNEFVEALEAKGFSHEEIQEAKILIERVEFQLSEIIRSMNMTVSPDLFNEGHIQEKSQGIQQLYEGFNLNDAIITVLQLEGRFGSKEAALDEYLLSLQMGIKLLDFIEHWESYEALKNEEGLSLAPITLADIEALTLKVIQESNQSPHFVEPSIEDNMGRAIEYNEPQNLLPSTIEEISPQNPAKQIMDEINQLNPNYTSKERLP